MNVTVYKTQTQKHTTRYHVFPEVNHIARFGLRGQSGYSSVSIPLANVCYLADPEPRFFKVTVPHYGSSLGITIPTKSNADNLHLLLNLHEYKYIEKYYCSYLGFMDGHHPSHFAPHVHNFLVSFFCTFVTLAKKHTQFFKKLIVL